MAIQVPKYEEPQIAQRQAPNVQVDAPANLEAFGGGRVVEPIARASAGVAKAAGDLLEEERYNADLTAVRSKAIELKRDKQKLLWDPGNPQDPASGGAFTRRGQNAFKAPEEFGGLYDKRAQELEESLSSDSQKAMFRRIRQQQRADFDDQIGKHVFREAQEVETATAKALVEVETQEAELNYMDPERRDLALDTIEESTMEAARKAGLTAPLAEQLSRDAVAGAQAKIMRRMLANGEDELAAAYYEENKEEFGKYTTEIEKELNIGSVRGKALRNADSITQTSRGLDDALIEASKIENADERIETENRLTTFYSRQRQAEEEAKKDLYLEATNILESTKGAGVIPPNLVAKLDLNDRRSLTAYAEQLQEGKQAPANGPRYYELRRMAADPALRQQFAANSFDLRRYQSEMTKSELHELIGIQAGIKTGDEKTNKLMEGFQSDLDIIKKTAADAGIDNDDELKVYYSLVGKEQVAQQAKLGRQLTDDEFQGIADRLAGKVITEKGMLWNTRKRMFEVKKGQEFTAEASEVPVLERRKIEEALTSQGLEITDDSVAKLYSQMLQKRLNGN